MVRVEGLKYCIHPTAGPGHRIGDMELNDKPLDPKRNTGSRDGPSWRNLWKAHPSGLWSPSICGISSP